jgi:hypothetical protein
LSYSSTTPNYSLRLWSGNGDSYDVADLTYNWNTIDTVLAQPRATNSAELLAAVPSTANFDGRLVYLTAADSGFPAKTLIRYNGSAWRTVGPHEILSSLPVTGLYGGRLVLLSASSGGFAAWTLVVYNGDTTSWQNVGRGTDVIDPTGTPLAGLSGNYAGRLIVISNATTEPTTSEAFSAYDVLRYDGSIWKRVGPQHNPTEATTIAGLGTGAAGEQGLIVAGTTPYSFLQVSYSNTYSKWVGETSVLASQLDVVTTASTSFTQVTGAELDTPWIPWRVYNTAGLKPQYRLIAELVNANVSGTTTAALAFRSCDASGSPGSYTTSATTIAVTGTSNTLLDSGWIDIPSLTLKDFLDVSVQVKSSDATMNASIAHATIRQRWVSS